MFPIPSLPLLTTALYTPRKERRGGPFDCNPKGDDCTGIVPCCGNLQCYWEDGYDALKVGFNYLANIDLAGP